MMKIEEMVADKDVIWRTIRNNYQLEIEGQIQGEVRGDYKIIS